MPDRKPVLGQPVRYDMAYDPSLLYPIERAPGRRAMGIDPNALPFFGFDAWNHYEVSWLDPRGKPMVATAEIVYDCRSPYIVESKSLKLYFNSLNNTAFASIVEVEQQITRDLEALLGQTATVMLLPLNEQPILPLTPSFSGECIDDLPVDCSVYTVQPNYLTCGDSEVDEVLCSNLLRSNCEITHQPDWGSVQICYQGRAIDKAGLLRYIVSFRNHNEFHEPCIERLFIDIMRRCQPTSLTVYGRYTRRGGLDINPYRSTEPCDWKTQRAIRLLRQ